VSDSAESESGDENVAAGSDDVDSSASEDDTVPEKTITKRAQTANKVSLIYLHSMHWSHGRDRMCV